MTSRNKSVSISAPTALAIKNFDRPGLPHDPPMSFTETATTVSGQSAQGANSTACKPAFIHRHADERSIRALQKWRLKRVVEYVDINLSSKVSLQNLAAIAGLSRMHFASQFRIATGFRPHEFVLRRRIQRSKELLRTDPTPIFEVAFAVGFQTQAHFTTVFKRFTGFTPRQWRTASQGDRQTDGK
jgi:AraC-like DNA-binding protein